MTASPAGIELTAAAEARLGAYLEQVRAAVGGAAGVSADEVAADIREHVECELGKTARPVGLVDLEAVLARLGPPRQWVPSAAPAAAGAGFPGVRPYLRERWRAAREALVRGPDDWRLAYLCLGVFALGVVAFPLFPLCLLVSYILARAGIAAAREKGVELGAARKWLLYPPVAIVSMVLLLVVAAVPFGKTAAGVAVADDMDHQERWELAGRPLNPRYPTARPPAGAWMWGRGELRAAHPEVTTTWDRVTAAFPGSRDVREALGVVAGGLGVVLTWGAVVGLLAGRFPGAARAVFPPLLDGFGGTWATRVGVVCLLGLAIWGGFAYRVLTDAGVV